MSRLGIIHVMPSGDYCRFHGSLLNKAATLRTCLVTSEFACPFDIYVIHRQFEDGVLEIRSGILCAGGLQLAPC